MQNKNYKYHSIVTVPWSCCTLKLVITDHMGKAGTCSLPMPKLKEIKTLNTTAWGMEITNIKDPVLGATWPGYFTPPLGAFNPDAAALSWVRSPNNGKVGTKFLCPHSRCFGSYFDVIFLMCLVSSGFSFKPTSSSSIILIDPVLPRVSVLKGGRKTFYKIKWKTKSLVSTNKEPRIVFYNTNLSWGPTRDARAAQQVSLLHIGVEK